MISRTLVLIRHAKSDWDVVATDRERPLSSRGRRQAPATGRWLAEHVGPIEHAIVSPARRARSTWDLVAAEWAWRPPVEVSEAAYTFAGSDLHELVRGLPTDAITAAVVGHNPALEELAEDLTGVWVALPTSAVAVIDLAAWDAPEGTLRYAGRPAER